MSALGRLTFAHKELVHLIWAVVLLTGLWAWLEFRRSAALSRLLSAVMQVRLVRRLQRRRRAVQVGLMGLVLLCGVLALMRPQTPGDPETVTGLLSADVMVVLDVSKSMLAEDAAPSRLLRAKAEVLDLLSRLRGQRVGLVAFAGRAQVLCPLTPDYGFFRMVMEGAGPSSVSRGGTRIGDGLRAALEALSKEGSGEGQGTSASRLILLITDGEDQDSYPLDAAKAAKQAGVRVVAIGFGDERGSEITLVDPATGARRFLTDRNGQLVRSRLDGKLLRDIALATDGAYVPAGVAALDLDSIINEHIRPLVRKSAGSMVRTVPREHYPALLLAALLFLLGAAWAGAGAGRAGIDMQDGEVG